MLRVAVDATGWTNSRGFGRFIRGAVSALVAREDVLVELITDAAAADTELPPGAIVHRVDAGRPAVEAAAEGSRRRVRDLRRAGALLRTLPVDVALFPSLHTWFPARGVSTIVGVHDATTRRLPDLVFDSRASRVAWELKERAALRTATRLFTVSDAAREEIGREMGIDRSAIAVVPEAPDAVFAAPPPGQLASTLASLDLDPDRFVLCAAGGISPHKDIETAVKAWARLSSANDALPPLVVVGALGSETYASSETAVRNLVGSLRLEGRVVFTDFVPDTVLAALYSGAQVVVNPSLAEGFGLAAVEAAACGAPLILSDIPAHQEILGSAATFFPPGDETALAAAVESTLADEAARAALGVRCRNAVVHLSWERTADRLHAVLVEAAR